jgi:hypothetical protein
LVCHNSRSTLQSRFFGKHCSYSNFYRPATDTESVDCCFNSKNIPYKCYSCDCSEIPWGYTGYQSRRIPEDQVLTQPMISAFNGYNTQAPITTGFSGCKDSCQGYVEAGGLATQCRTITGPIQVGVLRATSSSSRMSPELETGFTFRNMLGSHQSSLISSGPYKVRLTSQCSTVSPKLR